MPQNKSTTTIEPLIGADKKLPEITIKAVVLSFFLVVILASSNAFLGLKVGATIAASIPAAVLSMGILRLFKHHNVLEYNIVQTAASVGEAMISAIAFILPALILLHFWTHFNYWETVGIGLTGGILGVLFSVPLRRALLNDPSLRFPEGVAIGQVMRASVSNDTSLKPLVMGGLFGSLIALCQTGFRLLADGFNVWLIKDKLIFGFGLGFSPAIIAAGFIVGINVALSMLLGVIIGWFIGIPLLSAHFGLPANAHDALSMAEILWSEHVRFIGVGTMVVGGLWTLLMLLKPIAKGLHASVKALHQRKQDGAASIKRTELDMPINFVFWATLFFAGILFVLLMAFLRHDIPGLSLKVQILTTCLNVVYAIIGGFVLSAVSAYFAGLVGSTNSPVSGLLVAALLILCLLLLLALHGQFHFSYHSTKTLGAAALAITVTAIIGCMLTIANDTVQDLKAGQIVGATPWKQQVMLIFGIVVASFTLPLILELLFNAYGIGGVFPREGMDPSQMLAAPQAALMAAVAQGVFTSQLPWGMVSIGMGIAVIGIIVDETLKRFGMRLPVLAVGLGIYLPITASTGMIIGGVLSYFVHHRVHKRYGRLTDQGRKEVKDRLQDGLLLACGIVAGSTLLGVALAIPFAIKRNADALRIVPHSFQPMSEWLALFVIAGLCYYMYRTVCRKKS